MEQYDTGAFGERLRRVRKQQGLSAVQLAKIVGVTEAAIRSWETGRTEGPSLIVGLKIAKALVEDPDYLAFGTETPTP
jgi:transcriptional regulator with XRE-family HTH domain